MVPAPVPVQHTGAQSSLQETSLLLEQYSDLCVKGGYSVSTSCANSCVKTAPKFADLLSHFRDFISGGRWEVGGGGDGEGSRGDHCKGKKETCSRLVGL